MDKKEPIIFGPQDIVKAQPYIGKLGWLAGSRENLMKIIGQPDNRSILKAVRKEGKPFQNQAGWRWDYFSPDMTIEPKIYSGVDAEDATPWIGKEGWVGDTPLDIKHKRTKGILRYVLEPDCRLRFICNSSLWAFFQPIMEEEYRACRSLEELKSIMGRKIMRKTANGTVIKTIDEVSIENGKCYINQSTALNLFLKWVFEDTGKPVGVKNDEYFTHTNPYDFAREYFEDSDAEEVKIVAYKRPKVIPERFIDTVLKYVLELHDEEFSNTAQEYTSASGCMIKDTERYLKRIARHYTPHDCEPIGEFIIKRNEVKQ